jgi:hypothetical protein
MTAYLPCPEGSHRAWVVGLFRCGTHTETFPDRQTGEPKTSENVKILVVVQLDQKRTDGRPFTLALLCNQSRHPKSRLGQIIAEVCGEDALLDEDSSLEELLGKPCTAEVVHTEVRNGKVYANLAAITRRVDHPGGKPGRIKPVYWAYRSGRPVPDYDWIPRIFGQALEDYCIGSEECREYVRQRRGARSRLSPRAITPEA